MCCRKVERVQSLLRLPLLIPVNGILFMDRVYHLSGRAATGIVSPLPPLKPPLSVLMVAYHRLCHRLAERLYTLTRGLHVCLYRSHPVAAR